MSKKKNYPFFSYYIKNSITKKRTKVWVIDPGPVSRSNLIDSLEKIKEESEKQEKIQEITNEYDSFKKELNIQKNHEIKKNKQKI